MHTRPGYFDARAEISIRQNRLPHWEQDGASYFITFRLADSLPKHLQDEWRRERAIWQELHPEPWSSETESEYHNRFSGARERWLDASYGACLLRNPDAREVLMEKLSLAAATVWSHVIMPNHVHVLVSLPEDTELSLWLQLLKGGSSYAINRRLLRKGTLWAKDYFDRLIRDESHFFNCARYIRNNPAKARLPPSDYTLVESRYVRGFLMKGSAAKAAAP